ncbi:MAG TPA: acyl-CoA reductase, partial [Chthoniobacteraceae bacterium]|nr:acyl-CoA reductase [Chthoniobacteraceae bacterium]
MNLAERLEVVSHAASHFPFLGNTTSVDLLELIRCELGHADALDRFVPRGNGHYARAIAPRTILHFLAGNTPAAGLQSVIRGLALGSHNKLKLPSDGFPEIEAFRNLLPSELAALVEFETSMPQDWLASADAVIAFGSDETIAEIRRQILPHQIFVAHGHRISFGVVFGDPTFMSIEDAACDASA